MRSQPVGAGESNLATQNNDRRDDARGGSFLLAHQQLGLLALPTNPSNGQTLTVTVNGTAITVTFVTTIGSTPNNVLIGPNAASTALYLIDFLRRPDITTFAQIAASNANQQLLQYVGWAYPGSSTSIVPFSLNKTLPGVTGNLTSFNITTTVTGGTWTAHTMQLYVEDGTYYINGARYLFTGGSTPTVTAPVSHPRIDVLTVDNTGTLAWTTGTESLTPTAPSYPANKIPICELYNAVGETALYDNDNIQSLEGYIYNDVRPTTNYGIPFSAVPDDILPDTTNTRSLGSSGDQWLNIYGENIYNNGALVAATKFGGTGADGALSVTSGTTTINLGGASYFEKNYTTISITGTGQLTFSNPSANGCVVVLKATGNVTITSSASPAILGDYLGASSGNDGVSLGGKNPKTAHNISIGVFPGGTGSPTGEPYRIGAAGANLLPSPMARMGVFCGSGGQQANGGNNHGGGAQSKGGIGLLIECGGSFNFTGAVSCKGQAGANGTGSTSWNSWYTPGAGGAGNTDNGDSGYSSNNTTASMGDGGGGGGSFVAIYNFLTANSGTITVTAGAAGTGGIAGQAGTDGLSYVGPNTLYP